MTRAGQSAPPAHDRARGDTPMIPVHRLTHPEEPVWLNPNLIQTVETTPDTVVALTTGARFVVQETPERVAALVRDWHASIAARAKSPELVKTVVALPIT